MSDWTEKNHKGPQRLQSKEKLSRAEKTMKFLGELKISKDERTTKRPSPMKLRIICRALYWCAFEVVPADRDNAKHTT